MTVLFLDDTLPNATVEQVDAERERRKENGFMFEGHLYQCDQASLINLGGASTNASIAIMNGAQEGDYRWADDGYDFQWITFDNQMVRLDAPGMVRLGQAAFAWVTLCTYAAKMLKERIRAGERIVDVTGDALWPPLK